MGGKKKKKKTMKNTWPSKRKWPVEDLHKQKLTDLYREPDTISEIQKYYDSQDMCKRMPEERNVQQVLKNIPEGKYQLENQEKVGWTMLQNTRRKWMSEAAEKQVGLDTPGN